jgi:hypothetical protein
MFDVRLGERQKNTTGRTPSKPLLLIGVSKIIRKPEPELKLENRETGDLVPVPVWKIQKPGTSVPVPGFWYPIFTGLLGTEVSILFNNMYILI